MEAPQAQFPFRHHQSVQIRFNDIDLLGHLNNAIYMQFMDLAKVNYFKDVLGDKWDWDAIAMVVVNINCNFYAPTYIYETVEVLTTVAAIGEHSMQLDQRVVSTADGCVKCACRTVMAAIDPHTKTGAPVDPAWRRALEAYERRSI